MQLSNTGQPSFNIASITSLGQGYYCIHFLYVSPRIAYLFWINHLHASNHKTSSTNYYPFTLDNLKQLSNGHLSMQHLSWRHLSISAISQLLLAWFWPNFKGRFLGPFWTYPNCHNEICRGNISPCNVCPYQEYFSCYWPDFDRFLDHL